MSCGTLDLDDGYTDQLAVIHHRQQRLAGKEIKPELGLDQPSVVLPGYLAGQVKPVCRDGLVLEGVDDEARGIRRQRRA